MRLVALYVLVLALSGCQWLPAEGPFIDTFKAMRPATADVVLSDAQRRQFPYASHYLRIDDGTQALLVLARFAGNRSVYASSEGHSMLLQQGRVVSTTGFATDIQFMDLPLPPSVALKSTAPVCWSALWRARGQQIASNYRLQGCMRRVRQEIVQLPEGKATLVRVEESVSAVQAKRRYENIFWLDPVSGQVVASDQRGGPNLPLLRLTRVVPEPVPSAEHETLALAPSAAAEVPAGQVHVQYAGLVKGYAARPANTAELVEPWVHRYDIDWHAAALYRLDNTDSLYATRDALVRELEALAVHWQGQQRRAWAFTVRSLANEVRDWRLAHRVSAELNPHVLYLQASRLMQLKGQRYYLVLPAAQLEVPVWGAVFPHALRWQGADALAGLDRSRYLRPGADPTQAWLTSSSGQTQAVGLRDWNSQPVEWEAGSSLFIALAPPVLPTRWADLNQRLLALAHHRLP